MKQCSDTCDCCIYIGEGDFYCDAVEELVITDWVPVYSTCIRKSKNNKSNKKGNKNKNVH